MTADPRVKLGSIVFVTLLMAVIMSFISGTYNARSFADYHDDAEIYNRTALQILDHGRFHEEGKLFVGAFRRSPGYPIFLALAYLIFGKNPVSAWVMQALILVLTLLLLYDLSKKFLPPDYIFLPALLLSLSWFITVQVTKLIPEVFSLFLLLLLIWSYEKFFNTRKFLFLLLSGAALAWLLLIKPIALYFIPILLILLILRMKSDFAKKAIVLGIFIFLSMPIIVGGAWILRSLKLFDTWQIQSGSYVVGWKSLEVTVPRERFIASFIGGLAGDIFADKYLPGYAKDPEPYGHVKQIFAQMRELDQRGLAEAKKERVLYKEAALRIREHPVRFVIAGITGFLRQNTPMNHQAQAVTHMFSDEPSTIKMLTVLGIRLIGYAFLAIATYGLIKVLPRFHIWGWIIIWVLGYNILYAFFTHNEARYMIPLWPLYYLLFTIGVVSMRSKIFKPSS